MSGALLDGLRMSIGTLTALPVAAPSRVDRDVARTAMVAAPLPGALLGLLAGGVVALGALVDAPALVTGAAAVGAVAAASRGLHLDGLADTVDGLSSSTDRERVLAVMRSGDVGPHGVVALMLVLLAQISCVATLAERGAVGAGAVAVAVFAGRSTLPVVCSPRWPAARPGGLGAAVVGTVRPMAAGVAALAVLLVAGVTTWVSGGDVLVVGLAAVAGWVAALALVARVVRRIGGVTGDVLGAAVEIATTVVLVVLATAG